MNYPPGFPPHLAGLPFMPWSQYAAAARLPPGPFPSPYLPTSTGQIGSPSPHSQLSKSKSPITAQPSLHHNSSHFPHSMKHENKDSLERRDGIDEDEIDNTFMPRGPSPEPKIEDTECHRSQSAMLVNLLIAY